MLKHHAKPTMDSCALLCARPPTAGPAHGTARLTPPNKRMQAHKQAPHLVKLVEQEAQLVGARRAVRQVARAHELVDGGVKLGVRQYLGLRVGR